MFYASATWILIMGGTCTLLYREPARDVEAESRRTLGEVFAGMVEVVGNLRFFLLVSWLLVVLVMGSKWWSFGQAAAVAALWLVLNLGADLALRAAGRQAQEAPWFLQRMRIGEGRCLLFLLLMAGFWTSFNQIFMTLPEYIRDYTDTSDLLPMVAWSAELCGADLQAWSRALLDNGQLKPEYLVNLNAFGIILFQILISYLVRKTTPLTSIIGGVAVTVASFLIYLVGASRWVVVSAILVFSVGEMLASPRSKEYAGRIAPPHKVGMYMGYFYWCVALGNLFGGLLSGVAYQHFGPEGVDRPNAMWILFATIAGITAASLLAYDRWIKKHAIAGS